MLNLESLLTEAGLPLDPELLARTSAAAERKGTIPSRKLRLVLRQQQMGSKREGASTMSAAATRDSAPVVVRTSDEPPQEEC